MPSPPYAESLVIPHPNRWGSSPNVPQFLGSWIRQLGIKDSLQTYSDTAEYEDNALAVADVTCSLVRETLWFPERKGGRNDFEMLGVEDPVALADLPGKQVAKCFGFTVVASECLDINGIEHWIGFSNGHSTILLPTEKGEKLHMVDPVTQELSQDLRHSMVSGPSGEGSVNDDMGEFGRSAVELSSLSLVQGARGSTYELLERHPWLSFNSGYARALALGPDPYGQDVHPSRARMFMSIFLPEEGRQMLHDYDDLRHASLRGDQQAAAGSLYNLRGSYPNLDARQSHTWVKDIVRELGQQGKVGYARKLLKGYFDSFVLMHDDSRVPEAHGDLLSILARESGDVKTAHDAVVMYERVLEYRGAYREAVSGKLARANALRARLETGAAPAS